LIVNELFHKGLTQFVNVKPFCEAFANAVDTGETSKDKGKRGWKFEHIAFRKCLQISAHGLLGILALDAHLVVLERAHKVPRQLFHYKPVGSPRLYPRFLHSVHEHLGIER
jgi:hypothetical protein